ncbi:alpha/beta hydrolase [Paracoccus saliphilus]|uniref:Alpha/beta fold hydrolase n=1 Tax=Paracoccus saliphilus TaxID=405559 RepID=A0AA46A6L1_9RHOB|nr:alpha/beta fold hydrolase [Paracoccus saliphilus]WCR01512.1 alpha/beta fold hydrolase [Paracoccus saliphilus]SIS99434.1 Esterase/lipase superfamily enzyme [Paracoccus saliphilus]
MIKPSLLLLCCVLTGCAVRPDTRTIWPVGASAPQGETKQIFVATTRETAQVPADGFTSLRSPVPHFAEFAISIPPGHVPGEIEWPRGETNPRTDFAVASHMRLDKETFLRRINAANAEGTGVFVHGYNYNFPEALFRSAQMAADAQISGAPILFSWPSSASLLGYASDRESVTYSRDALAELLTRLGEASDGNPVTVFGHSMGGWLVMEALRQMRIAGEDEALSHLEVLLAAPDIDVDVFRQQLAVIETMEIPMVVMVSPDDRALELSALAGQHKRVGALDITDPIIQSAARDSNVVLIDISAVDARSRLNHDRYIQLASVYPALVSEMQKGSTFTEAGAFVLNSAGQIISAPLRVVDTALGQ